MKKINKNFQLFFLMALIFTMIFPPMTLRAESGDTTDISGGITSPFTNQQGTAPTQNNTDISSVFSGNDMNGFFTQLGGFFENLIKTGAGLFGKLFASISKIVSDIFPKSTDNQFSNLVNSLTGANTVNSNASSNASLNDSGNSYSDIAKKIANSNTSSNCAPGAASNTTPAASSSASAPAANDTAPASNEPGNGNKYGSHAYSPKNVISDKEFTDSNYMSLADIKNFLTKMGSQLVKNIGGVDVADAIKKAADASKVNPLVLLATLQKEKGLVQTKKAITQRQLDWACGVGAYDGGTFNSKYKGFAKQISSAASTYKKLYDGGVQTVSINYGKSSVTPLNAATTAVYRYTPHSDGAKLFHTVYESYKRKFEAMKS